MRDPIDPYDASPPALTYFDPPIMDENPTNPFLADNSSSEVHPSPIVGRSRGRPRRQRPAAETHPPKIEPKRQLRSKRSTGSNDDDPWALLSKAPSITPSSPTKPQKARTSVQKPVNNFNVFLIYISDHISTRARTRDLYKKASPKSTNRAKSTFSFLQSISVTDIISRQARRTPQPQRRFGHPRLMLQWIVHPK